MNAIMNIDAGLPQPIPLHIFVHTVNPSLQGQIDRGSQQPRERRGCVSICSNNDTRLSDITGCAMLLAES